VALQVERIVLRSRYIDITLRGSASPEGQGPADPSSPAPTTLHLPWTPTSASARKGITWKPSAQANLDPATSEALLIAIARARSWMNDLTEGRVNSFEAIARSENKVERHIRRLIPLAFVSPRIVEAIANGGAPADPGVVPRHSIKRLPSGGFFVERVNAPFLTQIPPIVKGEPGLKLCP
jgi:site-specific DNA recombinase